MDHAINATVSTKITIQAPAAKVFTYLTDLKYLYLWNPQIRSFPKNKVLSPGSTYKTESVILGISIKSNNTVIGYKRNKELVIENPLGNVCYTATFRLNEQAKRTTLVLTVSLSATRKIYVFTKPVLKQLALRELRTDLQALKVAVENNLE